LPLAQAQSAKYQRICDVLGLKPGMRVLEIGCGWGGFAEHASQQGIAVHGITISNAQLEFAQRRLANKPLAQLEWCDYRDLHGQYDAIVSIEMFEAVGEAYWQGYFRQLRKLLKPGGKALVQSITIADSRFERIAAAVTLFRPSFFLAACCPAGMRSSSRLPGRFAHLRPAGFWPRLRRNPAPVAAWF
jgi:cyclopropane-fatty-acyl-phospholipid synthase